MVAATANWVVRSETTQFAVAATNHSALSSDEPRRVAIIIHCHCHISCPPGNFLLIYWWIVSATPTHVM